MDISSAIIECLHWRSGIFPFFVKSSVINFQTTLELYTISIDETEFVAHSGN